MSDLEGLMSLKEVEAVASFTGFVPEDFEVFSIPGFADRMPALRARIKPKLIQLGELLTPRLSDVVHETFHPHVAQHLRRTVNPPVETWVAFSKEKRAYKPYVHFRVGISSEKVRMVVFVEDYADEKLLFAENLRRNARDLAAYFAHHPTIRAAEIRDQKGDMKFGSALNATTLRAFADRMTKVKGQHAVFGIPFACTHPVVASGPELQDAIVDAALHLKPLYDCGKPGFKYTYVPEPIISTL